MTGQNQGKPSAQEKKPVKPRKVNIFAEQDDNGEEPNSKFTAAMEFARQQAGAGATTTKKEEEQPVTSTLAGPTVPAKASITQTRDETAKSTTREEEEDEEEAKFEDIYQRETYYIRRTNVPRLKRLLKKFKKQPGQQGRRAKYDLMEEALEYLFEKYGIE